MKLIQVGFGSFGRTWYGKIKENHRELQIVVVDENPEAAEKLMDKKDRFYTFLDEAIEKEKPDFILNVTPPKVHTKVNNKAFDYKLPVLCEKPIAEDYTEAIQVVERAFKEDIPFMIAENYRTYPEMRKMRKLIEQGSIGEIASIHVDFFMCYVDRKGRYLSDMKDPLLEDVAIHHFDSIRYVAGSDAKAIFTRNYNPRSSWYNGSASLLSIMEMKSGIMASYTGSLVTKGQKTRWYGDWRIEGTEGTLMLKDGKIRVMNGETVIEVDDFSDIETKDCLDEFILSLMEKRNGETCGTDYIKTQAMVHFSKESSRLGRMVDIPDFSNVFVNKRLT